jgi:voltage-gated potassium channel Kch
MIENLFLGTLVIAATIIIHTFGLIWTTEAMRTVVGWLRTDHRRNRIIAMITTVFGVFATLTVEIWLWALLHLMLGVTSDFETALYFSAITFSTVGYGDIVPPEGWRLFTALEAISGFLLVGWSTAYLVAAGIRVGPFKQGEHF